MGAQGPGARHVCDSAISDLWHVSTGGDALQCVEILRSISILSLALSIHIASCYYISLANLTGEIEEWGRQ